ncbi:hypothetical protein ACIRO1_45380 [Streptomyces sp. NPDC102381]|jgi:hypothetical protein|uniref:hypothetical protein n=1 Tax=Streptomyces sp. NPDC102381 TaxID=3366164 RepID=UPI00382C02CE
MDTFNSIADTVFTGVAWFMGIALGISFLTLLATPLLKRLERKSERRREAEALAAIEADYRRQLQKATDLAISAAIRAQLNEPVTADLQRPYPLHVTIADVVARALDDFALRVPRNDAAAMLRARLEFRGHARWPDLITDAFDEEDQTP